MHPENTIDLPSSQELGRFPSPFATIAHDFSAHGGLRLCATMPGVQCSAAVNFASAILQGASRVCSALIDTEKDPAGLHAVMILIDQAKALIDSALMGIERAEDRLSIADSLSAQGVGRVNGGGEQ